MATIPTNVKPELICPDQAGSLNTTTPSPPIGQYVPPDIPTGEWEITDPTPDECAVNEVNNQQQYVAESINISGAPLKIYALKGVHQQGEGSVLSEGNLITSTPYPGHPASGINGATPWWSSVTGTDVTTSGVYVGVDFGIKKVLTGVSAYEPKAPKWTNVGAISLTQSNNLGYFATQVKVEIADGSVTIGTPQYDGIGDGTLTINGAGSNATQGSLIVTATAPTTFSVSALLGDGTVLDLGTATVGTPFYSTYVNFTITAGATPFAVNDAFTVSVDYIWRRVALFNVVQSPSPQILNLKTTYKVKAVRVTPTIFTGTENWEVVALDVLDSPPTDINNIQDLFFNENRDRDYITTPIPLKGFYTPTDSVSDLSKFGLSILDQYTFTFAFATMVAALGRPLVVGDIIEVIPEMQYDQNLLPVRKFLEVTDTGWASSGFSPHYQPVVYRVNAQIALPSQETRDIFGTIDTQKYLAPDAILSDDIGEQINTTPLTATEEIIKDAFDAVPERGSDDIHSVAGVVLQPALPPANAKGQPTAVATPNPTQRPNIYIEAGLPPNGEPYGEGFTLPAIPGPDDGDYFRLNYPPETRIPARLYRFSSVKNRWIYVETDRRGENSSFKPSIQKILQSPTSQPLGKK